MIVFIMFGFVLLCRKTSREEVIHANGDCGLPNNTPLEIETLETN